MVVRREDDTAKVHLSEISGSSVVSVGEIPA